MFLRRGFPPPTPDFSRQMNRIVLITAVVISIGLATPVRADVVRKLMSNIRFNDRRMEIDTIGSGIAAEIMIILNDAIAAAMILSR